MLKNIVYSVQAKKSFWPRNSLIPIISCSLIFVVRNFVCIFFPIWSFRIAIWFLTRKSSTMIWVFQKFGLWNQISLRLKRKLKSQQSKNWIWILFFSASPSTPWGTFCWNALKYFYYFNPELTHPQRQFWQKSDIPKRSHYFMERPFQLLNLFIIKYPVTTVIKRTAIAIRTTIISGSPKM